jgi:hypothetical protein
MKLTQNHEIPWSHPHPANLPIYVHLIKNRKPYQQQSRKEENSRWSLLCKIGSRERKVASTWSLHLQDAAGTVLPTLDRTYPAENSATAEKISHGLS